MYTRVNRSIVVGIVRRKLTMDRCDGLQRNKFFFIDECTKKDVLHSVIASGGRFKGFWQRKKVGKIWN